MARVAVDVPLPHLDRLFDYLVPERLADSAAPGCRVRVRFAGQLVDGFLVERAARSDHGGRLAFLERVVSPEPVLTPEIAALAREVADRYAGTLADVLRLAIPPRHARVEAEPRPARNDREDNNDSGNRDKRHNPDNTADDTDNTGEAGDAADTAVPDAVTDGSSDRAGGGASSEADDDAGDAVGDTGGAGDPWVDYPAGASFLAALRAGRGPRAVWTALPGMGWPAALARAVRATLAGGRGALVVVAGGRDVARVDAALTAELTGQRHVALTAELGPAERYRRWLAVLRGEVRAVVGTRAAMFAPVHDLGLVVVWDDGDDVHAEPHAPYPHAREVLALRAHRTGAAALIGGFGRTTEATRLVETGWAHALVPARDRLRQVMPRVHPAGEDAELARDQAAHSARLPHLAFRIARQALVHGPVLVQVPRRGYLPALACVRCRGPARCPGCQGALSVTFSHAAPYCRWCGRIVGDWSCPECGGRPGGGPRLRATVVGARRTAEELGRAFPGAAVRTSGRDGVLDQVSAEPALVVATPGAEPVASGGYAAALLLDGWALLGRADLRVAEETLRRWLNAAALVRAAGPVVVMADGALAPVQALLRWDPVTHAERELADRRRLRFPPAGRLAALTSTPAALREFLETARLPEAAELLGPVSVTARGPGVRADESGGGPAAGRELERALVRVPHAAGSALARALKAAQAVRSARKVPETVRVQMDPLDIT